MQDDPDRPIDPQDEDSPAAVQWMLQQAAAGQSNAALPANLREVTASALAPIPLELALAARRNRVTGALRGNERLTAGLAPDPAEALMQLGLQMAGMVIDDTAGLDDAAAEDILQPRVRAVRRLMMSVTAAVTATAMPEMDQWLEQSAVALGDRFTPPDETTRSALRDEWRALAGKPAEQIAALHHFIENSIGR